MSERERGRQERERERGGGRERESPYNTSYTYSAVVDERTVT